MDMVKFNKVAAMMDSPNENEANNARRVANKMLKEAGKTWGDVTGPQVVTSKSYVAHPGDAAKRHAPQADPFGGTFSQDAYEDLMQQMRGSTQQNPFSGFGQQQAHNPFGFSSFSDIADELRRQQGRQQAPYVSPEELLHRQAKIDSELQARAAAQAQQKSDEQREKEDVEFKAKVARELIECEMVERKRIDARIRRIATVIVYGGITAVLTFIAWLMW